MLLSLKVIVICRWSVLIIKLICSFYSLIQTIIFRHLNLKKLLIFYLLSLINFLLVQTINLIFVLLVHHLHLLFCNFRLVVFWFSNLFFCLSVRNIQSSSCCIVWLWKLIEIICLLFKRLLLFNFFWLFDGLFYEIDFFYYQVKSDVVIVAIIDHSPTGKWSQTCLLKILIIINASIQDIAVCIVPNYSFRI